VKQEVTFGFFDGYLVGVISDLRTINERSRAGIEGRLYGTPAEFIIEVGGPLSSQERLEIATWVDDTKKRLVVLDMEFSDAEQLSYWASEWYFLLRSPLNNL